MKEIIKEIIEFDLDEGRMDYLDDMIDVFSKDGCEMVDILFDRFLKKYYADIDVSNERMTINLTDEEGHGPPCQASANGPVSFAQKSVWLLTFNPGSKEKAPVMSDGPRCSISNKWPPPLPICRTTA